MATSTQDKLFAIVSTTFGIPVAEISLNLGARSIPQWDSLGHLDLIAAIEDAFGISFDGDELFEAETVGDFLKLVEKGKK